MDSLRRFLPVGLLACLLGSSALTAPGDEQWDFRFGTPGLDALGFAAVWHQGELYLGGGFHTAGNATANSVTRWDGTRFWPLSDGLSNDQPFTPLLVYALASYGGRLYAGGEFTRSGDNPVSGLACWDGTAWSGVGGLTGVVHALSVQADGLYVGGALGLPGDTNVFGVARWDGFHWETFGSSLGSCQSCIAVVHSVAVQGEELFVVGEFTNLAGQPINGHARWTGTQWEGFPSNISGKFYRLLAHQDELFACGLFRSVGEPAAANVARWNGVDWEPLGAGFDEACYRLCSDGTSVLAVGLFGHSGETPLDKVARWDGESWQPIGTNIFRDSEQPYELALSPEGELIMAGYFSSLHGQPAGGVARWDGSRWIPVTSTHSRGVSGNVALVYSLAPSRGGLCVGGYFERGGTVPVNRVGCLDASGWSALGEGVVGTLTAPVLALAAQGSEIFAGGRFTNMSGHAVQNIARWDGTGWSPLASGLNDDVRTLAASGEQLFAGGDFTEAGGLPAKYLACWDGTAWNEVGGGLDAPARALALYEGRLIVGGSFTNAGAVAVNAVGIWDGAQWHPLGTGIPGERTSVQALAVDGTNLYVGGQFESAGGVAACNVARWSGTEWSALGEGPTNGVQGFGVYALAFWRGRVFVGGSFTNAGGRATTGLACWDGSRWSGLGSGVAWPQLTGNRSRVFALAVDGDDLYVGGAFTVAGGHPSNGLARWVLEPSFVFDVPRPQPPEQILLRLRGAAGLRVRFEASPDLFEWTPYAHARGENEAIEFEAAAGDPQEYFRAVLEW